MNVELESLSSSRAFEGIYDLPEAARYLSASWQGPPLLAVSSSKMIGWIRKGVASRDLVEIGGRELLIGFEDLISMRVIAALRAANVSWPAVREAERWLRRETGSERPFATETIWTGQRQVFIEWKRQLVSASTSGQAAFDFLLEFLIPVHGLLFNEETHMAKSWEPSGGVVLEPAVQFGAPCIKGTRIPTRTVAGMIEAGDSPEYVARAFDQPIEAIEEACEWERLLRAA
ncbi:MAG: DUF433 domain-containing protein [Chloroflexi bacterium]|nr:DUF433 domain-containing protein [Chloroflexota bacterium]